MIACHDDTQIAVNSSTVSIVKECRVYARKRVKVIVSAWAASGSVDIYIVIGGTTITKSVSATSETLVEAEAGASGLVNVQLEMSGEGYTRFFEVRVQ